MTLPSYTGSQVLASRHWWRLLLLGMKSLFSTYLIMWVGYCAGTYSCVSASGYEPDHVILLFFFFATSTSPVPLQHLKRWSHITGKCNWHDSHTHNLVILWIFRKLKWMNATPKVRQRVLWLWCTAIPKLSASLTHVLQEWNQVLV